MQQKCVVLCGGGTGGHIYPNLALADELSKDRRVCYIGNTGGLEEKLCKELGIEFFGISAPKFKRKITALNLKLPFAIKTSVQSAKDILKRISPAVIFSKGGYVSLPVCLAASALKIPVLSHESDLSVGLANKIAYRKGGTLLTSFKPTYQNKKRVIHTGAPLRKQLFEYKSRPTNNNTNIKKLLVIGGSQGAKAINESVVANLYKLTEKFEITHITGAGKMLATEEIARLFAFLTKSDRENMLMRYHAIEYSSDMGSLYQNADIAISRGGANALFELLASEIPTLVIPLEKGSRGDQIENAEYFAKNKLCHTLSENHLFGLFEALASLDSSSANIKQNIKEYKRDNVFDGRRNIIKLILSH